MYNVVPFLPYDQNGCDTAEIARLKERIRRQKVTIQRLTASNSSLTTENAKLNATNKALAADNLSLTQINIKLRKDNNDLRLENSKLQNSLNTVTKRYNECIRKIDRLNDQIKIITAQFLLVKAKLNRASSLFWKMRNDWTQYTETFPVYPYTETRFTFRVPMGLHALDLQLDKIDSWDQDYQGEPVWSRFLGPHNEYQAVYNGDLNEHMVLYCPAPTGAMYNPDPPTPEWKDVGPYQYWKKYNMYDPPSSDDKRTIRCYDLMRQRLLRIADLLDAYEEILPSTPV